MAVEAEDGFQKELIELFVQEAHEWLQQIHVALDELQQAPPPDRHLKLAQTIKAGITNLGGSAATISLGDVERASFSTLPFVEAVANPACNISTNDFILLCKQLGHIHTALTRATGVRFDADSVGESAECVPVTMASSELLAALRAVEQAERTSGSGHRNLVRTVIAQIEGLIGNGVAHCDVTSMRDFLERGACAEEAFHTAVLQQLPQVTEGLAQLKTAEAPAASCERFQALLDEVAQLWTAAQQVNASQAVTFFMGLHGFLSVALQRRVVVAAQNYDAVESRLRAMAGSITGWVNAGREERAAIGGLLPTQS
jgi:chemotaxis protein histidine kinase CheA